MINRKVVMHRIERMQACLQRLEELRALPRADFLRDFRNMDSVRYELFVAVGAGMDALNHVVAAWQLATPADDHEAVQALVEANLLPVARGALYARMIGFCDGLLHRLDYVSDEQVYSVLYENLDDLRTLIADVEALLAATETHDRSRAPHAEEEP